MGIYINPGNRAFEEAVNSQIYVDKTGLLEKLNKVIRTEQKCVCVSRARRFGKSMAANMIRAYYSRGCDSGQLFQGYEIARHPDFEKHLNKYNVICFDVAAFLSRTQQLKNVVELIDQTLLKGLKKEFPTILDDTVSDTFSAIIEIYESTQVQFIVIIDEWDVIIREAADNDVVQAYFNFLRLLFKSAESQDFLALGYMTGILPIKKLNNESALNNFYEYTMTEPAEFAVYFGFTQTEVEQLCRTYLMDTAEIAKWYDGYLLGHLSHMYNPNSLVQALLKQEISCYWKNTSAFEGLNNYIACDFEGLKNDVLEMLVGGRRGINIHTFKNDLSDFAGKDEVLTALVHLGYLTYDAQTCMAYIPNEEVRMAFTSAIQVGNWKDVAQALSRSRELLDATIRGDEERVAREIQNSQMQYASIIEYNDENALSCAIMMAYFAAREHYTIIRELPSGKGFADLAFLPKPNTDMSAMIVELKWNRSASSAIAQIKNRQYAGSLEAYKENLLLVGINYKKADKTYTCKIEQWMR